MQNRKKTETDTEEEDDEDDEEMPETTERRMTLQNETVHTSQYKQIRRMMLCNSTLMEKYRVRIRAIT